MMTRKMMLIAGVAGLAIAAPAMADREGRGDRGNSGRQSEQRAERPGGAERQQQRAERQQQRMERPQMQRQERREVRQERPQFQRQERREARQERPQFQRMERAQRAERSQRIERAQRIERRQEARQQPRFERQQRQEIRRAERQQQQRIERRGDRREARVDRRQDDRRLERFQQQRVERRAQFRDNREDRRQARLERRQDYRDAFRDARRDNRQAFREARQDNRAFRRQFEGALARQFVSREMRPMRAFDYGDRRIVSVGERFNRVAAASFVPSFYRTQYYDTPDYYYRYNDDLGYLYRVNRGNDFVSALIPLFGGYGAGDPWPMTYRSSYVPASYQSLYYDTPDYYYRYDGHGVYQIDAQTQLISALVALVSGNGFGVGQVLPQANYGAYNVPLDYRASYYDTDDAWYRYGDGYIYQIDPYSYQVEERYPIYANYDAYSVGEAWPVAYPDYNVPYGYRDLYYDTPQYNYRYANGAIYQVDPTSQLITAIVSLLSGQDFAVGQQLPAGYDTYNVPFAYRDRYADTADNWYRYNDGYVYQVDPYSGLIEEAYPVYA